MAYGPGGLISPEAYQRPALGGLAQSMLGRNVPVNPYGQTPTGQAAIGAGGLGGLAMQQAAAAQGAAAPNRNQMMQQRLANMAKRPALPPTAAAPAQAQMAGSLNTMFSPIGTPGMNDPWAASRAYNAAQQGQMGLPGLAAQATGNSLNSMFGAPATRVPSPVAPAPVQAPIAAPAPIPRQQTY